jgi:hypothetical protein
VSCFYAEIQLSGKNPENIAKILSCQKTHGARRRDEGRQWPGLTTRGRGPGLATPTCGEATTAIASTPPFAYIYVMTHKYRGCIVVLSINKSVEPNEEQKVLISGFNQGFTVNTSKQVFRGN